MARNVTMKDIAKKLDISTVTVSKALADKDGVGAELKEKIIETAKEMGYRYNIMGKSMREGINYNVGILISDVFLGEYSFYYSLYKDIVMRLTEENYSSMLEIISKNQEKNCELPSYVESNKVDGIIVIGQIQEKYLEALLNTNIPCVFLDFYNDMDNVENIVSDNIFGGYLMTNHLIKMGHTEIGYVGNILATSSIMDRYLGMYKSLLQHGIVYNEDYLIIDRDENGFDKEIKLPEIMPTAYVCNCDKTAYRLIQKLKDNSIRVPEDVSVVGFDDYIYSTLAEPKLTTFRIDMEKMAQISVKSIIDKIQNENYTIGRSVISGEIIVRNSVKKIN